MAYVCLRVGFKLGLPEDGRPPSMTGMESTAKLLPLLCGIVLGLASVAVAASPLPTSAAGAGADSPRLSAERLQRLDGFLEQATGANGYLGAVSLVAHDDEVVQSRAYGYRDLARQSPMQRDSIFRIYSMTKTVTTVAVLMLMEEGKLNLDDPVEKYLPEFSGMQIFTGGTADLPKLRPANRKLTLHQLLTHTAGFATGGKGIEEATRLLEHADLHGSADLEDFSRRLSKIPLAAEPGTVFRYDGTQMEVVARIVEVVSGQRFDDFLQQRIFDPLLMTDTGFSMPAEKRSRIVDITVMGTDGKLQLDGGPSAKHPGEPLNPYPSGAGGLYSTAPDFMRLCRMLLDGGALDGAAILKRKTAERMMVNQLTLDPPVTQFSIAEGFGLGGSVLLDPAGKGRLGLAGQFGWSGAASTYFSIDPRERTISVLLLQHLPNDADNDLPRISTPFYNLVQQALAR
ncbi:MAG TPA: serine hydrolase domain-containing protein [Pseudoxanthomonas sp.]|nr:serine hydrolase domain-containing protein [Pseudoxanthomonas sp.]